MTPNIRCTNHSAKWQVQLTPIMAFIMQPHLNYGLLHKKTLPFKSSAKRINPVWPRKQQYYMNHQNRWDKTKTKQLKQAGAGYIVTHTRNNNRIKFCSHLTSWGCCVQLQTLTCKTMNFLLHCIYSFLQTWLINISLSSHHSFALSHLQHNLHMIYILQEQWCSFSLLAALMTIPHTNFGLD